MGNDLGQHFRTIVSYLDKQNVQHSQLEMIILHSRYEWYEDRMAIDVQTAIPLSTTLPGNEHIIACTLPGGLMASPVLLGDDLSIGQAFAALYRWVKGNQYEVIDPPRQVRLQRSEHMHPGQYVTEVQLPVKMQARSEAAISSN